MKKETDKKIEGDILVSDDTCNEIETTIAIHRLNLKLHRRKTLRLFSDYFQAWVMSDVLWKNSRWREHVCMHDCKEEAKE
jgi:hypothetical protein